MQAGSRNAQTSRLPFAVTGWEPGTFWLPAEKSPAVLHFPWVLLELPGAEESGVGWGTANHGRKLARPVVLGTGVSGQSSTLMPLTFGVGECFLVGG